MTEKNLTFKYLKKELAELKSKTSTSAEHDAYVAKDMEQKNLWRGITV